MYVEPEATRVALIPRPRCDTCSICNVCRTIFLPDIDVVAIQGLWTVFHDD